MFAKRILGFAGLPFLSLITPFLFLPILARVAGADAWLAIAVGQSSGGFFALIVALGFNTVGPPLIALAEPSIRPRLLVTSIHARALVWLPSAIVAAVIASVVSPSDYRVDAAVMAIAMSLTGLSSAWFMIGLGRASLIAIYEISPRIVATVIAAIVVLNAGDVLWYPALLVVASLVSVSLFALRTAGFTELKRRDRHAIREVFRANRSAVTTEVAGGAYNSLAVTFVGAAATTAQAAAYVSGDKLYRIGQYSVSALGNALQGWVVEAGDTEFAHRIRRSLLVHGALGFAGLTMFAVLGPWLSEILFGAEVAIDRATALGLGVATLGIALGTSLGRITLVGMGARRQFMVSVLLAAAVGVPAILALSATYGAAGGAWGLAIGETVSVCTQALFVWRIRAKAGAFIVAKTQPDDPARKS
ncbi:O-antigen/teichoic acid export membrane protein [Rhodoglobus vestalii]|uniref:O-antigen/teichoic acid export membrane protein n=1 Tax=Rhodoglobus vestalii TaxID=193384 RepID=A0A8H2K8U1_9MICO|nr:oligosaccharide flippase family protein [Rhodoglobus vestalii]TQO20779.1 O-antigen/teichoic acid export membrane protein [Rhodoglobus vestalii]